MIFKTLKELIQNIWKLKITNLVFRFHKRINSNICKLKITNLIFKFIELNLFLRDQTNFKINGLLDNHFDHFLWLMTQVILNTKNLKILLKQKTVRYQMTKFGLNRKVDSPFKRNAKLEG